MKDKYSRTVEVDNEVGTSVQVTEYIQDKLLVTLSYTGPGEQIFKKELLVTEDEAFAVNALLNDWTSKRQH